MSKEAKNKIVPELRFPEFRETGEWKFGKLDDLVEPITPPKKLPSTSYLKAGSYPIIDQSQNIICGWTNDNDALIVDDLPLIIFGDHTCILKLARRPFAQGADGIKIFKPKVELDTSFLYQYLLFNPVKQEDYKRHFSILKEKTVFFPEKQSGEQQKIATCLSSLDDLITAESQKLDALKDHKKGLMQELFPAEGETVPKRRFEEFENAGEWSEKSFDQLFEIGSGRDYKHLNEGDIPVYGSGGYMLSVDDYLYDGESACIGRKGTINKPMFLSGKFWTVDTLFYTYAFKDCLPKFIYLIFQNINWLNHNEAGGIPSLSKTTIGKIVTIVPKPEEQKKIAESLFSLDELIAIQTEKIEELKRHKKGLLQGMFPKVKE